MISNSSIRRDLERRRDAVERLVRAAEAAIGELSDGSTAAQLALAVRLLRREGRTHRSGERDAAPWHGWRETDGESWTCWRVFPGETTDAEAAEALDYPRSYYSGPGRSFAHAPAFIRRGSRLLVVQMGGLDV